MAVGRIKLPFRLFCNCQHNHMKCDPLCLPINVQLLSARNTHQLYERRVHSPSVSAFNSTEGNHGTILNKIWKVRLNLSSCYSPMANPPGSRIDCVKVLDRHYSKEVNHPLTSDHTSTIGDPVDANDKPTTHFGFQTVPEDEKVEKVYEVFKKVADKYDLMNDVMSAGVHRLWKDEFIRQLSPHTGMKLIDVAGGTGDIAFRYLNYSDSGQQKIPNDRCVTICDINEHMLKVGEQRAAQLGITQGVSWLHGNAENLPVEDNTYDAYTIAFGIRNCTHVDKVLSEAYRVLKPGGRFMCLEFSQVRNSILRSIYDQYSFQVIPVMGHVIAQDWNSYQYLVESIRKFPDQETFALWIEQAGFSSVTVTDMTFGAVALHSGFKL